MADTREYVQKFANENGGDIFVEDVKLAEAGHQTTISDEEIVLKGTDGVMHKIDKSSFSEAVRGVLGPILYNLSKESGITKVLTMSGANANAADIGTTTLANLASALGVGGNLNLMLYSQSQITDDMISNGTVPYKQHCLIVEFQHKTLTGHKGFLCFGYSNKHYLKLNWGGESISAGWKEISIV